jgi:hypothetical protein
MTSSMRNFILIIAAIVVAGVVLTQVTYIPKAPAADFGIGTLECATAVGPASANSQVLEANGWKKRDSSNDADRYERSDVNVRLVLKEGLPGCLTQGIAESEDQFPAIAEAVSKALKARYGDQFKTVGSVTPNEQTYQTGDLLHVLSAKKVPDGYQVRVTSIWDQSRK